MLKTKILLAAVAAVALSSPVDVSLAQYRGPPIIIQTPQLPPPPITDNLKPLPNTTPPAAPAAPAAASPTVAAPAAAPARPCAANTKC
jgi:hypothetical protein